MTVALVTAVLLAAAIALLTAIRARKLGGALAHQASHDSLTGLPNRMLLCRRLERELAALDTPERSVEMPGASVSGSAQPIRLLDVS